MNVLFLYYQDAPRVRPPVRESLRAFSRQPGVHPLNTLFGVPPWVARLPFDAVLFHYTFLATKWHPPFFRTVQSRCSAVAALPVPKAAMAHDEYVHSDSVCAFLRGFDVRTVYSVAPPAAAERIYAAARPTVDRIRTVLTGHVDETVAARWDRSAPVARARAIDVGYRVRPSPYWLGRRAQLKQELARRIEPAARVTGLRTDISCDAGEGLVGHAWYEFLASCRVVIGCEGGAGVHDRDGSVRAAAQAYLREHPGASYDEVEGACFPGRDGELDLFVLSPRHVEACVTRTCQVLLEGHYSGVLEPGRHYIELRRDFSNLDDVLRQVADVEHCAAIANASHQHVVVSGRFGYGAFARSCLDGIRPLAARPWPASASAAAAALRVRERAGRAAVTARWAWTRSRRKRAP